MRQSSTLDRRLFIKAASRFVGQTAAAGSLLSLAPSMPRSRARSQPKTPTPEPLIQPPERRSANGILDATITAAPGPVQFGDRAFTGLLYNGAYVPPTLRARPGRYAADHFPQQSDLWARSSWLRGPHLYRCWHPFEPALSRQHSNTRCASRRLASKVRACSGITPMHTASSMIKSSPACRALWSSMALTNFSRCCTDCRNAFF